jgi:hypothetical protein
VVGVEQQLLERRAPGLARRRGPQPLEVLAEFGQRADHWRAWSFFRSDDASSTSELTEIVLGQTPWPAFTACCRILAVRSSR